MKTKLEKAYKKHKSSAKERGIQFLLSFDEWLKIWRDSGHLHERGRKLGQYCMARFGDTGPYAIGNVEIILHRENSRQFRLGKPIGAEQKEKQRLSMLGMKLGPLTKEAKLKIGAANRGRLAGSKNPTAKLTEDDVIKIFLSDLPQYMLAQQYAVHRSAILRIKSGLNWGHLTKGLKP